MHIIKATWSNYETIIVVNYNDAVIEEDIEQRSHTKIKLTHQETPTKIASFANSKLKTKNIIQLCPNIQR